MEGICFRVLLFRRFGDGNRRDDLNLSWRGCQGEYLSLLSLSSPASIHAKPPYPLKIFTISIKETTYYLEVFQIPQSSLPLSPHPLLNSSYLSSLLNLLPLFPSSTVIQISWSFSSYSFKSSTLEQTCVSPSSPLFYSLSSCPLQPLPVPSNVKLLTQRSQITFLKWLRLTTSRSTFCQSLKLLHYLCCLRILQEIRFTAWLLQPVYLLVS